MTAISVAIPVHNGADYLAAALDSVLAQTDATFTAVVSDNASSDDTPAIVAHYVARDARLQASRSPSMLDQAGSINRAIDLAGGEWVKPLCHDDLLEPECLATLNQVVRDLPGHVGLVGHGETHLYANGYRDPPRGGGPRAVAPTVRVVAGPDVLRGLLGGSGTVGLPALTTTLIRRSAWETGDHFDPRYIHCDTFCWARMLTRWDYAFVDAPLSVNRIHGRQVAVEARATRRSTRDHDEFWNAFVDEFGRDLDLSRRAIARARLRGPAAAGTSAAVHLLKQDFRAALGEVRSSPVAWWPVLPVLTGRAYVKERRRIAGLRAHVPVELIYP